MSADARNVFRFPIVRYGTERVIISLSAMIKFQASQSDFVASEKLGAATFLISEDSFWKTFETRALRKGSENMHLGSAGNNELSEI